ncbi:MAG: hypothetical protein LT071_07360 [Nocardioides sp.]|nr:hypothetical protein [Nocardioides sp.]
MEILLWLVPSLVVLVVAMGWVTWLGREGRGEVDRDVAVRRLAEALSREHPMARRPAARTAPGAAARERSSGIAVRPSRQPARDDSTRRAS